MNSHYFLMKTLRPLVYSRYCNLLAPEGWGVRVEGVYALEQNQVVSYFYSDIRNAYVVSDGRRMLVISRFCEKFVEKDPNKVFKVVVGEEHPYRLEWYQQTIPTSYLEWLADRVEKYLYPFDYSIHVREWSYRFWWGKSLKEDVLIAHPRLEYFDKDGNPVFVKYREEPETLLGIQSSKLLGLDDDDDTNNSNNSDDGE